MTVFRPAAPADGPALLRLTARLAAFPVPEHRQASEIELADHAILRRALEQPADDTLLLVAEDAGEGIVGYIFLTTRIDYFTNLPHAHIEILTVAAGQEGKGVGRRLMEAGEAWARGRGYSQMTLNVFAANERARAVYARLGYEPELVRYRKALPEREDSGDS
jgi:GNAT superfamily N-acetyltransferase